VVPALEAAGGYAGSQIEASNVFEHPFRFEHSLDLAGFVLARAAICASRLAPLAFCLVMTPTELRCDGCGQAASTEHVARRLQRLESSE